MAMEHNRLFWSNFFRAKPEIEKLMREKNLQSAFGIVDQLLREIGLDLAFELAQKSGGYWLIFSPEGDLDEANKIDSLVKNAPDNLKSWQLLSRKPRQDMPDPLVFIKEIYDLDLSDIRLALDVDSTGFVITAFSRAFDEYDEPVARGCAFTFLSHLLGEREVMETVSEVIAISHSPNRDVLTPEAFVHYFDELYKPK